VLLTDLEAAKVVWECVRSGKGPSKAERGRLPVDWSEIAGMVIDSINAGKPPNAGLEAGLAWLQGHDPGRHDVVRAALEETRPQEGPIPPGGGPTQGDCPSPAEKPPVLSNFRWEQEGKALVRRAVRMEQIERDLDAIAPGWPKSAGGMLFAEGRDHTPRWLASPDQFFAWADSITQVDWPTGGGRLITQKRFFEHTKDRAPSFDAVETLPHWPPLRRVFYMHPAVSPQANGMLDRLLDFFVPHSVADRELIRAFVLTVFWGGAPGSRPAFLFEAEKAGTTPDEGRGSGKSILVAVIAQELAGGMVEVSAHSDIEAIRTRLLSAGARQQRILRLDNVKSHRFSWDDLEGMITSPVISGHVMYHGEGCRPNLFIVAITTNDPSLSKDLALRVIPVRLDRPSYSGGWEREVREFIRANRAELLADIGDHLQRPSTPITVRSRWADWESEVLSRVGVPEDCQAVIAERREALDDDRRVKDTAEAFIAEKLSQFKHDPETCFVRIPSVRLAEWMSQFRGKTVALTHVVREIKRLAIPCMNEYKTEYARGMSWKGPKSPHQDAIPLEGGLF
jgi:hypothetical protein